MAFYVNEHAQYSGHVSAEALISGATQQDETLITLKQAPVMRFCRKTRN